MGHARWYPHIATVEETLAFQRLFRALRNRRAEEAAGLIATWVNIAFTRTGIEKLTSADEVDKFPSDAFKVGMAERAGLLGVSTDNQGNPKSWVIGGRDKVVDILLIVASDSQDALRTELNRIKDEMRSIQGGSVERSNKRGLQLLYEEEGNTSRES